MNLPFGQTRTHVAPRHALIAADGHVTSNVPGITGAAVVILINEAMGAKFAQVMVTFEPGGRAEIAGKDGGPIELTPVDYRAGLDALKPDDADA